jgi:YHS domain-containing protein
MKFNLLHEGTLKEELTKLTVTRCAHGKNEYSFCSGSKDEDFDREPDNNFEMIGRNID